jgi:hypothetical protein
MFVLGGYMHTREIEGLLGVLNCWRAHMSSADRGEISSQHHITIYCI